MNRSSFILLLSLLIVVQLASVVGAVTIDTVLVGDPGNPGELSGSGAGGFGPDAIVGAVPYAYRIGTYEVTNAQYAEFLNARAAIDPLELYNTQMGSNARGGISRSGASGSYNYAPRDNMADKPVTFVSWYDAIRFTNWLHNGQGSGDTETGAYTLIGGTPIPANGTSIAREPGALWFMPNENEWYKAAYYDPRNWLDGGPYADDHYWLYATQADFTDPPTIATADVSGNIANPGPNVANYASGASWNGLRGGVTTVGSAGPLSQSYYGTYDQAGNAWEFDEDSFSGGVDRGIRSGAWDVPANLLAAYQRNMGAAAGEYEDAGFRVATVPEPSTLALAAIAMLILGMARRRRRH